eukprot:10579174-Alexandrium_andersonii.AAC.1
MKAAPQALDGRFRNARAPVDGPAAPENRRDQFTTQNASTDKARTMPGQHHNTMPRAFTLTRDRRPLNVA